MPVQTKPGVPSTEVKLQLPQSSIPGASSHQGVDIQASFSAELPTGMSLMEQPTQYLNPVAELSKDANLYQASNKGMMIM